MSKVTDQLLRMTADASRGERATIASGVDEIRQRHLAAIDALVPRRSRAAVTAAVEQQIDELRAMLTAIAILREASPRSLRRHRRGGRAPQQPRRCRRDAGAGVDAAWVDARKAIVTDDQYTAAAPLTAETGEALEREVAPHCGRPRAGARRIRRRHARRRDDDARPRRVGLLGGDHRRRPRRRRDSDLDRRRRHAHRRSPRRARSRASSRTCRSAKRRSWPTSAPRCCTRAPSFRRSRPTFRSASSTAAARRRRAR